MIGQKTRIDFIIRPEKACDGCPITWAHFAEPLDVKEGERVVIDFKRMVAEVVRA